MTTTNKTAEELAYKIACLYCSPGWITDEQRKLMQEATALIEQAPLAAEQRGRGGWRTMDSAPKDGTKVLLLFANADISSGFWVSGEEAWFSGGAICRGEDAPTRWMAPAPTDTPATAPKTDNLTYVKARLAMIASQDYKACGYCAEDVALDALAKLAGVDVAHPVTVRTYKDGLRKAAEICRDMQATHKSAADADNDAASSNFSFCMAESAKECAKAIEAEIGGG